MAGVSKDSTWVKGFDGRGITCWRNKVTGVVIYSNPERVGLAVGPCPNAQPLVDFFTTPRSSRSPWDKYTDPKTKADYYHNRETNETTWKDPKPAAKKQPSPPKAEPKKTERGQWFRIKTERQQWFRIHDPKKGVVWYNEKTEKTQIERPDCLKKYR